MDVIEIFVCIIEVCRNLSQARINRMTTKDSRWGSVGVNETRRKKLEGTYFYGWQAGPSKENEQESQHWSGQLSMHGVVKDTWIPRGWFKSKRGENLASFVLYIYENSRE